MRKVVVVLLVALLTSCATQRDSDAMPTAKDQVASATAAWAAAFNGKDPARIAALYDADAVFWGTGAKTIATTPTAVAEYFKEQAKFPNLRAVLGEAHIRIFGDMAINTGNYTFTFPKGEIPARYTFVFTYRQGKWLIVEHHSSRVP
jgi:uncharacterized protein (TIGR02246 family)